MSDVPVLTVVAVVHAAADARMNVVVCAIAVAVLIAVGVFDGVVVPVSTLLAPRRALLPPEPLAPSEFRLKC